MRAEVRPIAVIDIDGVLADVRHRLGHLERHPKNWGAFFRAAPQDPPLQEGLDLAHKLAEVCEVVYLSGRPEHCRRDTETWFERHGLPSVELRLRRSNDYRPSREFKVAELRRLPEPAPVTVLIDDDPGVPTPARRAGCAGQPA